MICCNCWSCCLDLRAKVRLDDESIYSILFLVNKDANRRKEELSIQIEELKGLLDRPVTSQPTIINNDNRQISSNVSINRVTKQAITHTVASSQVDQAIRISSENASTPFAERFMRHSRANTPYGSKTPSFSHDMHNHSTAKKKQFALSRSFSEKTPIKPAHDMTLAINADAREFLILRLLDEQKFEDALEKSVQLVDMRKAILQDSRSKSGNPPPLNADVNEESAQNQLDRATLLLARCWKLIRRPEYSIKILDGVLLRQREASAINFDNLGDTLKLMLTVYDDLKQQETAISTMRTTIRMLKQRFDIDPTDVSKGEEPPIGVAQILHVLAEYLADIPDYIDEAIEVYLEEVGIYERLKVTIDWRTLYRLGQLLARRAQHTRAIHYFDLAVELILKQHGNNFNPLGDVYHSKALSLWQMEELHAALSLLRKALPIKLHHFDGEQEEVTVSDNAVTIGMINHALGEITEELGHLYDAIPFFEKAMEYYTLGYGTREHISVAQTLHGLGDLLLQLEVKKESLACFDQAYQLYSLFRGKFHLQNMDVLSGKAAVLRLMGRYQDAIYVLQFIYEVFSYEYGEEDSRVAEVQAVIENIRQDMEAPPTPHSLTLATNSLDETFAFSSSVAAAIINGVAPTAEQYSRSLASSFEESSNSSIPRSSGVNAASNGASNIIGSPNGHGFIKSPLFASPTPAQRVPSPRRALQSAGLIAPSNNVTRGSSSNGVVTTQPPILIDPTANVITVPLLASSNRPLTPPLEIQSPTNE